MARLNRAAASLALHAHCDAVVDLAQCVLDSDGPLVKALTRLSKAATASGALMLAHQALAAARAEASSGGVAEPNDAKLVDEAAAQISELETRLEPLSHCHIAVLADGSATAAAGGAGSDSSDVGPKKPHVDDAASIAAVLDALCAAKTFGVRRPPIIADPSEAEAAAAALLAALAEAPHSRRLSFALANALLDARRPEAAAAAVKSLQQASASSSDGLLGAPPATVAVRGASASAASAAAGSGAAGTGSGAAGTELAVGAVAAHLPAATLLAHAYVFAGDLTAAIASLKAAAADDPDSRSPEAAAVLALRRELLRLSAAKDTANEVFKAGRHADALKQYTDLAEAFAVTLGYTPSFLHANAAAAQMGLGNGPAALAACDAAIASMPYNARAWLRRAACLTERRSPDHEAAANALAVAQYLSRATAAADDASLAGDLFKARVQAGVDPDADDHDGGSVDHEVILAHPNNDREAEALLSAAPAAGASSGLLLQPVFGARASSSSPNRRLVIVDAFATWCGPCKMIAPTFSKLALSHAIPRFVKLVGDKCRGTAGRLGVRAFPTFIALLDGVEIDRMEGADARRLQEMVTNAVTAWRRRAQPLPRGALAAAVVASPVGKAVLSAGIEASGEVAAALSRAIAQAHMAAPA